MASKVVEYHLEDTVINLLNEGKSVNKIAQILNENYMPSLGDTISEMAVRRWVDVHAKANGKLVVKSQFNLPSFKQAQVEVDEDVNPYSETLRLIENCDNQIMVLTNQLDMLRNNHDIAVIKLQNQTRDLLNTYITRKQSLLSDIHKYQKDMSSFSNVKEKMQIIYNIMQEVSPESYEVFKKRVGEQYALTSI